MFMHFFDVLQVGTPPPPFGINVPPGQENPLTPAVLASISLLCSNSDKVVRKKLSLRANSEVTKVNCL